MDTLSYKTVHANKATVKKEWILIDANEAILGRLSSQTAKILRGKHKPDFTPHVDCGDNVIIINAANVKLSGLKLENKEYIHHTGYPGGQRSTKVMDLMKRDPSVVIEKAVRGMLPKNRLGRQLFKNLYIYNGSEHVHEAQKPKQINLNEIK